MKLSKKYIVSTSLTSALLLAGLAGCATDGSEVKDFFPADNEQRHVRQMADAQATAGAREDATIGAAHFTGSKLNSLGTEKLCRMVPDDLTDDLVVNLNLPANDLTSARKDAVMAYLKTCGMDASHVKIHDGANMDVTHPVAYDLARMNKTESGDAAGASSSSTSTMKPAMGLASGK